MPGRSFALFLHRTKDLRVGKELVLVSYWKSITKDIVLSISSSALNRQCCCAINFLMRMLLSYIRPGPMMSKLLLVPRFSKKFPWINPGSLSLEVTQHLHQFFSEGCGMG